MDLDILKEQLRTQLESDAAFNSREMIADTALQQHSNSLVLKIKKSVWLETAFAVIASIIFIYFAYAYASASFRLYFGGFACVSIAFVVALGSLLLKLNTGNHQSLSVKEHLQDTIAIIRLYIKNYFRFCMILLPVCLCFAVFIVLSDPALMLPQEAVFSSYTLAHLWLPLLICYGIFSIGMFFFTKTYLQKLYGKHLVILQKKLQELDTE